MDDRAYSGLVVLDMSQGMTGPYCASLLGQYGAKVIKVEPPQGDWIRVMGGGRGRHSHEILAEFGYSAEEIAAFERGGLTRQAN